MTKGASRSVLRRARHGVEYGLLRILAALSSLLPARVVVFCGHCLGLMVWALDARHRRIASENLHRAFDNKLDDRERRRMVRHTFARFGEVLFELALFPRVARAKPERWVEVHGLHWLQEALGRGRGALVTSGHFGNWEMAALTQARLGHPMGMVTRPLDNPLLESWMARLRGLTGNFVIHKHQALRQILPALRHGQPVALMIDQNARGERGIFVDFFGSPASTSAALGLIACKRRCPIVPVFSVPLGGGRYRIEYEKPLEPRPDAPDLEAEVKRLTQEATSRLEAWIHRHPSIWLWLHQRWRTRPLAETAAGIAVQERTT